MNKIHPISDDEIKALLSDIYRLNPPIQLWEAFNKFFQKISAIDIPENISDTKVEPEKEPG